MNVIRVLLVSFLISFTACGNNPENTTIESNGVSDKVPSIPYTILNPSDSVAISKTYVPTGFYYLTDDEGVKKIKDRTNEVYNLNRLPFVSVENISDFRVEKAPSDKGISSSLILTLDKEGKRSLEEGTGNPVYPYVAVVIGNRLLYVVQNTMKIKTGVMSIYLVGYSEADIDDMEKAIYQKK